MNVVILKKSSDSGAKFAILVNMVIMVILMKLIILVNSTILMILVVFVVPVSLMVLVIL